MRRGYTLIAGEYIPVEVALVVWGGCEISDDRPALVRSSVFRVQYSVEGWGKGICRIKGTRKGD
jgi:hypothetical protein